MATVEQINNKSNSIINSYEKYGIKVEKQSSDLYDNTVDNAVNNLGLYPAAYAYSLTAAQATAELNKILANNNIFYEDSIKRISSFLSYGYQINLNDAEIQQLAARESIINAKLVTNNNELLNAIQQKMLSNVVQGVSTTKLVKELSSAFPNYAGYSRTIMTTGLSWNFVDTATQKYQSSGFNWYLWAGPNDQITRENPCKKFVNHKFPAKDLDTLRSIRLGLYNCRHNILALSDKMAKDYPTGDINAYK